MKLNALYTSLVLVRRRHEILLLQASKRSTHSLSV